MSVGLCWAFLLMTMEQKHLFQETTITISMGAVHGHGHTGDRVILWRIGEDFFVSQVLVFDSFCSL